MNGFGRSLLLCFLFFIPFITYAGSNWWKISATRAGNSLHPSVRDKARVFVLQEDGLKGQLLGLQKSTTNFEVVDLPLADGSMRSFKVWETPMMEDGLAAKYPQIRTFTGIATDNPNITAKLDFTVYGFHAVIYDGHDISLTDPAGAGLEGYYTVHYKKDERREPEEQMVCSLIQKNRQDQVPADMDVTRKAAYRVSNGIDFRSYRLALACDNHYASTVTGSTSPTIAMVLSKMVTTMNRVNGVYEREFSVNMRFVDHEDTLIWTSATGGPNGDDPFEIAQGNAQACVGLNQVACDTRIGVANYDMGHVFTAGTAGLSQIGVICHAGMKAMSVTGQPQPWGDGFDIDFVAHEMGHEFGADHTYNNSLDGSCKGNDVPGIDFEPGSGSTIMAYAGICSPDNLQPHSDDYFHAINLIQINSILTTTGDVCPLKVATLNNPATLSHFSASYYIPLLTPFELTSPIATNTAIDTSVTYCWEQWNIGDIGKRFKNTHTGGPIFRSFLPGKSPTRVFPNMTMVLADSLSNAGTNNAEGEKVPDSARFLTFKLTVRNIYSGKGCFLIPDDTIHLDVINTVEGFRVTSQSYAGNIYPGNNLMRVTWNIAKTTEAPISCDSVGIYISDDGGYNWPFFLGNHANTGEANVVLPNEDTTITRARVKVKGAGNVFFNVNKGDFSIYHSDLPFSEISVFPSPVHNTLRIYTGSQGKQEFAIYNALGQRMLTGEADGQLDIPVFYWARGVYFIRFVSGKGHFARKFVVQ